MRVRDSCYIYDSRSRIALLPQHNWTTHNLTKWLTPISEFVIHTCMRVRDSYKHTWYLLPDSASDATGWRRQIGCLKLQVIVRKRVTNYRALLRKMTYKDKASYESSPPCIKLGDPQRDIVRGSHTYMRVGYWYIMRVRDSYTHMIPAARQHVGRYKLCDKLSHNLNYVMPAAWRSSCFIHVR